MKRVTKHVYETSDGKPFDIKADAEKHEARLKIAEFFSGAEAEGDFSLGENAASHIIDNLDDFAEIIRPLIRKPRAAKAEAKADEYEAKMKGKAA
jgi:hypothetical protein